jgi:hypothetical protein
MDVALNITGYDEGLVSGSVAGGTRVGLSVSEYITSKAALSTSDRRAKTGIKETSASDDLTAVLGIPVKRFAFIEKDAIGTETVGFIAQDVEAVAPFAVHSIRAAVPDVMCYAEKYNAYTLTKIVESSVQNVATGDYVKVLADDKEVVLRVAQSGNTSIVFETALPDARTYFVYGKVVDDFKVLNTDRMLPLVFNAVKELNSKLAAQQNAIDAILGRLAALETA